MKELKELNDKQRWKTARWTEKDENRLERLERGEINSYEESAVYARSLATIREFLITRVARSSQASFESVMKGIVQNLSPERKRFLAKFVTSDHDFNDDNESDMSSIEDDLLVFDRVDSYS